MSASRGEALAIGSVLLIGSLAWVNLMALPAFEDEASQLGWIFRIIDSGEWLRPFGDGKPLEAWPMVPLVWLGLPALLATRSVHVLAGMIGAGLTYRLGRQVDSRATALASGVAFAICPFTVYLERLALSDILLCTCATWVVLAALRWTNDPTRARTWVLAGALPLAALAKLPVGFLCLLWLPLALLLMPAEQRRRLLRPGPRSLLLLAHGPVAALALGVIATATIRVHLGTSPGFGLQDLLGIGAGSYPDIAGVIGVPRPRLLAELTTQLSWPVTVLALVGLAAGALLSDWRQRWLLACGGLPMLAIGLLPAYWFPRYLLFTLPPLLVSAASGWHALILRAGHPWRAVGPLVAAVCGGLMLQQSIRIVLDPPTARWSALDRFQYFEGPGSGYGYPQAAHFVVTAPAAPHMIYSLDGHGAYQLRTYLPASWRDRVKPISYGPEGELLSTAPARLANLCGGGPAWIVAPEELVQRELRASFGERGARQLGMPRVAAFAKPGGRRQLAIFQPICP